MEEKDLVFIYRYNDGELFAVKDEMVGYDYELASVNELDRESEWGKFIIVKEGSFKWDSSTNDYVKI